ncbi:MAG: RlmE family RNA methyltransferase [Acidiferrobacterales bacterium]|nr:RlmE family RNA methyltransferase [Acidiferrobacterales bacterium]
MSRNKSKRKRKTSNWANKQETDHFVKKARASGFRARAAFKLEQIDNKVGLIKPASRIADLGAAPGSWSQYAVKKLNQPGQIVAVDLLPMREIPGVQFIQGDFTDPEIILQVLGVLEGRLLNLVLSDMAPNITGIKSTDQARIESLQESVLAFCGAAMEQGGNLLTKLFEGESAVKMRQLTKPLFNQIQVMKPDASRSESKEIFLLCTGYLGKND